MSIKLFCASAMSVITALMICGDPASAQTPTGTLQISVFDRASREPIPGRIHLHDAKGTPQKAKILPFWHDHFVCFGRVGLELAEGDYHYEIERGPEYSRGVGTATVGRDKPTAVSVELTRLADLPAQFFVDWVRERMERIRVENASQREEILQDHRAAEAFWRGKVAAANAE